jgi:hypothetical protein
VTRSYLDQAINLAELNTGEKPTPESLAARFALHGHAKRVQILDAMDAEPKEELGLEDLGEAMEKAEIRKRCGDVHELLRKAGR